MTDTTPSTIIGCLLDVSGSMRNAIEAGQFDELATDRLHAVLRAALKLAESEQRHNPNALIFVGVFGLKTDDGCPAVIDLCAAAAALLGDPNDHRTGHDLLISRANTNDIPHISKYILEKLTSDEARIVDAHLGRHPELVKEFVDTIPPEEEIEEKKAKLAAAVSAAAIYGANSSAAVAATIAGKPSLLRTLLPLMGSSVSGSRAGRAAADVAEARAVEDSHALRLARHICDTWLQDFAVLRPQPVTKVTGLLKRVQERRSKSEGMSSVKGGDSDNTIFATLRRYMYGLTPTREAMHLAITVFFEHLYAKTRVLVIISNGESTDEPLPMLMTSVLQRLVKVKIATVYLTDDEKAAQRRLYHERDPNWDPGQQTLFSIATKVAGLTHPIPALACAGWKVPSAGEVALYATVSSAKALDEFCSLLLSDPVGSAEDILHKILKPISYDSYVDDKVVRRCRDPSDQGASQTCYAHAIATVVHMALSRVVGREGGYPSIERIRERILERFPAPEPGPDCGSESEFDLNDFDSICEGISYDSIKPQGPCLDVQLGDDSDSSPDYDSDISYLFSEHLLNLKLVDHSGEPQGDLRSAAPVDRSTENILRMVTSWYHPRLSWKHVDEDGARQAVLHRRPVLTNFYLSASGWDVFDDHFNGRPDDDGTPIPTLKRSQMEGHRQGPIDVGHSVVMTGCSPDSLTFLNSWGKDWGNGGSFSVENSSVLESDDQTADYSVRFYDIYWRESDLTEGNGKRTLRTGRLAT